MWYKARPMARRGLSATLLVILAMHLLGGLAFTSVCPAPCPDDARGTGCPPICALCTTCTHTHPAIVQRPVAGAPLISTRHFLPQQRLSISSQLADDIFHVPLLG